MDFMGSVLGNADYFIAGRLSLFVAVVMSVPAIFYGLMDFLKIDSASRVWKKAGLHGLLNFIWFLIFCTMLFYRVKHDPVGSLYLLVMAVSTIGLFYSNYLGADLIISHRIGIEPEAEKKSEREQ
jgi:uncharacterized membrane protein